MIITTLIAALLLLAAAVELLPEHLAAWRDQSQSAWDSLFAGVRSVGLWLTVGVPLLGYTARRPMARRAALAVCTWGAAEAILRPGCRLLLPMDRRPAIPPGGDVCTAADMPWWYGLTPLAAAMCAVAIAGLLASTTTRPAP